ncbi:major facilitator superfamily transporter [Sodiomyces alkalinus F11]|uniref:Major facilitator superfamily transporter n=1 Tax=Sodiomyces alkalinus (strain CBS 110278 / VKM F-3762 / F11) TaxID=1314773 RepID=A0A3N2PXN6_SODAK|nr:major facilitator superfamily transporter [Sodiomyces alkalinus F11]ROT39257.1 major facilitator superfamily transporter [Sodiomyces alkalinus F11]
MVSGNNSPDWPDEEQPPPPLITPTAHKDVNATSNPETAPLLNDRTDTELSGEANGHNGYGTTAHSSDWDDAEADAEADEDETTVITASVPPGRLALILGAAYLGVFLGAIDSTIIATLSAPISSEFKSLSLLSWLATAYLISNAACQPLSGRLTDIFGRGPGLILSNLLFAAGNLICGLARNQSVMILGRVVAGIGGGGLMSIATFLASDLVPLRRRGVIQGVGNIAYGSGAMLGGVFGGFINDNSPWGWRLAFLVQVPPVLVSAVIVALLVRVPPKASQKSYLARIDFVGAFLTIAFLVLLLLGLNTGGNSVPWSHPLPLTAIPLSVVALVAFLVWESRARLPIIPVRLLAHRTVFAACLASFLGTMVIMMSLFYLPVYLQVIGLSTTDAGLRLLPAPLGVSICSVSSGYIMKRTGRYLVLGIASGLLLVAASVILTTFTADTPTWVVGVAFFMTGGSYGAMLTVTLLACIAAVDHSHQAVITSATYLARSCGGTIGVTVGSTVYQNLLKTNLWARFKDYPDAAERISRIRDDLDELKHLPEAWKEGVMESFIEAFRGVWLTILGVSLLTLVSLSFMKQHTLHSTLERR